MDLNFDCLNKYLKQELIHSFQSHRLFLLLGLEYLLFLEEVIQLLQIAEWGHPDLLF